MIKVGWKKEPAPPALVTGGPKVKVEMGSCTSTCAQLELEFPPPGAGLVTDISPAVLVATSVDNICAWSSCAETEVVDRGWPFQFTTAPATKFAPQTVRVNAPLPGETADGFTGPTICGMGFWALNAAASESIRQRVTVDARFSAHLNIGSVLLPICTPET